MKKLFYLLAMPLLLLGACSETGEEIIPEIGIDIQTSQFEDNGGVNRVTFTATTAWSVQIDNGSWCSVEPTSGKAGEITLTVTTQPNTTPEERTATVKITAGDVEKSFTVTQKQKDVVTIENSTYEFEAAGGEVEITVSANVEYTYSIDDEAQSWVSFKETRAVTTSTYVFEVAENELTEERTATISFTVTNGDESLNRVITITQAAAEVPAPAGNEIWYTSTDGNIVTPYKADAFGAAIVSNTYEDGKGVITFDGDVTAVGKDAFYRGAGATLETVTLPKGVTEIGDYAFSYCSALKNISMRNGITKIGKSAFYSCQELTNIILPNSLIEIGENAFKSSGLTSITIPESVTIVGDTAFLSCENLSAFYGKGATDDNRCLVIDGVIKAFAPANYESDIYTIPYGATTVGYNAFSNLTILTEIIIPESVTTIDRYAFASSNGLLTVTLPKSITTIGMSAFQRCQNLATVYCKSTTPSTLSSNVFFSNAEGRKIYVPTESVEAYKAAWSEYADAIEGYDFE